MNLDEKKSLSLARYDHAKECLTAAQKLIEQKCYKDATNRSYYAIFTAVRAVLANDKIDFSKHAGVIAYFQREYVKTGKFDKEYSKYLNGAFQIRNNCDYADFFLVSKEDAIEQYQRAEKFIKRVEEYLN